MRFTWKKDNIKIEYSNPIMTSYPGLEGVIKDINDVMYFYYTMTLKVDDLTIRTYQSHDEHKVENLPMAIDRIIEFDMSKSLTLNEYSFLNTLRKERYARILLDSKYGLEYSFLIERHQNLRLDVSSKGLNAISLNEEQWEKEDSYSITISENWGKNNDPSNANLDERICINDISTNELLELKHIAQSFIEYAICSSNEVENNITIECYACNKNFKYLENRLDDNVTCICPFCGHKNED